MEVLLFYPVSLTFLELLSNRFIISWLSVVWLICLSSCINLEKILNFAGTRSRMSGEGCSDQEYLLRHSTGPKKDLSRAHRSRSHDAYELEDFDISDIGAHRQAMRNPDPPAYSSTWEEDTERSAKQPGTETVWVQSRKDLYCNSYWLSIDTRQLRPQWA